MALFRFFMTDVMLEDIVKCTNFKITQLRNQIGEDNRNISTYSNIDLIEIRCLIGLLIMAGTKKDNHVRTLDMFSTWSASDFYRSLFFQKRFEFLIRSLRFDDPEMREERIRYNKFSLIRDLWDATTDNWKKIG